VLLIRDIVDTGKECQEGKYIVGVSYTTQGGIGGKIIGSILEGTIKLGS